MKLSEVILEDGRRCASLLKLLASGRWDLSGAEAEELVRVKHWVASLAQTMAPLLKTAPSPPVPAAPSETFRIKNMGPIGAPSRKQKKK